MEQTNMVMAMYQAMAAQGMVPKMGGKSGDKASDDFQKLLDQKAQAPAEDAPVEGNAKAEPTANQKEDAPVQEENPLEQVKRLAEQGYAIIQPSVGMVTPDGEFFKPGEYVIAWKDNSVQFVPVVGLDQRQMNELKQIVVDFVNTIDVSDPEADAMLEATDPTVEHSPAQLLEEVVDDQAGKVIHQAVEQVQPQEKAEDDKQAVEVVDVEQDPRPLFHDVKAAPVKVGEVYDAQQTEEVDVAAQIDAQMAQALNTGENMVRIQLTPANLGQVVVEISQSTEGVLKVALTASSIDTRGILERHANDLQNMLASRTQQSVEVNVQRSQEDQQSQNQQHSYDGHNGHAQDGQERRQRQQQHTSPEDFMQQLRLGLIPGDGI